MAIFQINIRQVFHNQEVMNVWYAETPTASYEEAAFVVDALRAFYADIAFDLVPQWAAYAADIRRVDVAGFPSVDGGFGSAVVGANSFDSLPTQIAMLLSFFVGEPAPNRARKYLAGFGENQTSNSQFTDAIVNTTVASAQTLLSSVEAIASGYGIVTVRKNQATDIVEASNRLQQVRGSRIPATQRRRRIGAGI